MYREKARSAQANLQDPQGEKCPALVFYDACGFVTISEGESDEGE
ncbi:TPA: hypothetical protein ACPYU1_003410 [Raoultella planticola]